MGLKRPGTLADTARTQTQVGMVVQSRSIPQSLGPGHESSEQLSNPWELRPCPLSHGELVNTVGPRTQARVSRDNWTTTQTLGPDC